MAANKGNPKEKEKIRFPHLVICEGLDAKRFLIHFLEHLIESDSRIDNNFQVMDAGGITELPMFIKSL
jgi:hypothetical protein